MTRMSREVCPVSIRMSAAGVDRWANIIPGSGGEKNFLEFMFPDRKDDPHRKHLRTTCSFAMMFLVF